jgi:DNA modification methylase
LAVNKISFCCSKCGKEAEAPDGTNRYKKLLCKECYGKKTDNRINTLNDLSGSEWAKFSKSIESYPDTRSEKQRQHGACYPKSLARQHIEIFTKSGDLVFVPFVGAGTTIDASLELNRKVIGIELNPIFANLAIDDIMKQNAMNLAKVIIDDSKNLLKHIPEESVDFILTSPPYANLLRSVKGAFAYKWREHSEIDPIDNPKPYSELPNDIGNMNYEDCIDALKVIFMNCYQVQKQETYAVWVVKDFRNLEKGIPYINFHGDIIDIAKECGYILWDIRIYNQTEFRPLVCLGYPSRNFYLNIGHSYILIFKKTAARAKRRK